MATVQVTEANFDATVREGIVLLDFWAIDMDEVRQRMEPVKADDPDETNVGGV